MTGNSMNVTTTFRFILELCKIQGCEFGHSTHRNGLFFNDSYIFLVFLPAFA